MNFIFASAVVAFFVLIGLIYWAVDSYPMQDDDDDDNNMGV